MCTGQDTWNLSQKFNSQAPALCILGLRAAISKSQGPISRLVGVRVQESQGLGFQSPGSQGLRVLVQRSQGPRSRVSCPDFRLCSSGSWVSGSQSPRVSGFRVPGPRSQDPRSRVSGPDFRLCLISGSHH